MNLCGGAFSMAGITNSGRYSVFVFFALGREDRNILSFMYLLQNRVTICPDWSGLSSFENKYKLFHRQTKLFRLSKGLCDIRNCLCFHNVYWAYDLQLIILFQICLMHESTCLYYTSETSFHFINFKARCILKSLVKFTNLGYVDMSSAKLQSITFDCVQLATTLCTWFISIILSETK